MTKIYCSERKLIEEIAHYYYYSLVIDLVIATNVALKVFNVNLKYLVFSFQVNINVSKEDAKIW